MAMLCPAVFVAGAAVMIYEFLAVRLLAPYFGSTLDVWASEIAVCLAGLALGAMLGGWWADRSGSWRGIGWSMLAAGLTALPMEWFARHTGNWLLQVDTMIHWHPLAAAFAASFVPLFALGAVGPQAIRLAVPGMSRVGRVAGVLTALTTAGSIAGALSVPPLLTAFGVRQVLYAVALFLALFGVILIAIGGKRGPAAALLFLALAPMAAGQVLFDRYSAYHHIVVEDRGDQRMLRFDDAVQTIMSLKNPWGGGFEYADFFHVPVIFNPDPERVLFIGLGGGTGPKAFLRDYPDVQVDAVEIDPVVVDVAKEYFGIEPQPRLRIHTGDGRAFLNRGAGRYDAINVDAYASGPQGAYLPYHLATVEFFETAKSKLKNGGHLVYNAVGKPGGLNSDTIAQLAVTMRASFYAVYAFEARGSINTVFVAVHIEPDELDEEGLVDGKAWPEGPWLQHPLSSRELRRLVVQLQQQGLLHIPGMERRVQQISRAHNARYNATILTDNHAPVDTGRRRTN
jgi:spermidine synthase